MTDPIDRMVDAAKRTMREFISALVAKHHREFMGHGRFPAQIHDIRLKKHIDFDEQICADGRTRRVPIRQHERLTIECEGVYARRFAPAFDTPMGLEFLGIEGMWMVDEMLEKFWVCGVIFEVRFSRVWS